MEADHSVAVSATDNGSAHNNHNDAHHGGPATCWIAEGATKGTSVAVADLVGGGGPGREYACVFMCCDCAASHMSSVEFCTTKQRQKGTHVPVHLAIPVEGLDATRATFECSETNFAHCATDDWNVADACEGDVVVSGKIKPMKAKTGARGSE